MKPFVCSIITAISSLGALPVGVAAQQPFNFQGSLEFSGMAVTDTCAFRFELKDDSKDGNTVGPVQFADLIVTDGVFDTSLDFSEVFDGTRYWLEISVRNSGGDCTMGAYEVLAPRTQLEAVPYAYGLLGPSTVAADDVGPALTVRNDGGGDGIRVDSAGGLGIYARGGSGVAAGYFAGDVVTEGHFAYSALRTYSHQIPVAAFEPSGASENVGGQDLDPYWNEVQGYIQIFDGAGSTESIAFEAPVNLPDSVTVTAVKLHYYDNDAANDVQFTYSLWRRALASTTIEGIVLGASVTSSGSSSSVQNHSGFVSGAIDLIQNGSYMYWMLVLIVQPPGHSWSSNLRFYGVTIEYETDRLAH